MPRLGQFFVVFLQDFKLDFMEDFIKRILSGELNKIPSLFTFLPFSAILYVDLWLKLTSNRNVITGFQSLTTLETIVIFGFFCATATFIIEPIKAFIIDIPLAGHRREAKNRFGRLIALYFLILLLADSVCGNLMVFLTSTKSFMHLIFFYPPIMFAIFYAAILVLGSQDEVSG